MAWKGLHLTQAAPLSLADGQCCVKRDDGEVRIAIEDLAWVIVDTRHATLTSTLISACMEAGVAMSSPTPDTRRPVWCCRSIATTGRRRSPNCRRKPRTSLKRRVWQTIVRRKISNQSAVLAGSARPMPRH